MLRKGLMISALAGMLTTGVAFAKFHVYVGFGPPTAVVETPPPTPGPGYVWTPGYYYWNGSTYEWVHGLWTLPPHHYHHYVAGVWAHGHHGYHWRDARWRR